MVVVAAAVVECMVHLHQGCLANNRWLLLLQNNLLLLALPWETEDLLHLVEIDLLQVQDLVHLVLLHLQETMVVLHLLLEIMVVLHLLQEKMETLLLLLHLQVVVEHPQVSLMCKRKCTKFYFNLRFFLSSKISSELQRYFVF